MPRPACLLIGCLSTAPEQWANSGEDPTLERSIYECKHDGANASYRATAFGGVIMPIAGLFAMRSTYNECMVSRGYKKTE